MAKTLAQLTTLFDNFNTYGPIVTKRNSMRSDRHGGDTYWFIIDFEGTLKAFQATKDFAYLNQCLDHWHAYQTSAAPSNTFPNDSYNSTESGPNDQYNDSFLTWDNHGTRTYTQGYTDGGEYPLFNTHGFQSVPQMLAVIYYNTEIQTTAHGQGWSGWGTTYQDAYDSILPFFETNVWDKWDIKGSNHRIYDSSNPLIPGDNEALFRNQTHIASHASNMALYLWKITGTQKYKDFLDDWNFDCDSHGYNDSTTNGFEDMLRTHTYTDTTPNYNGFVWDNSWSSPSSGETDTNHWQAELRHMANQLMFDDSYWEGRSVGGRNVKAGMLETAKWCLNNSENEAGNYRPLLTPSSGAGKQDGSALIRTGMLYYGAVCYGRFSETLQSDFEDSSFAALPTSDTNRHRVMVALGNMMYNRAYLDGTPMYLEFSNSTNAIPVITLVGASIINIDEDTIYNELGATYTDAEDGTGPAVIGGDVVNTAVPGTYIVTYNFTDSGGGVAVEVTRQVNVLEVSDLIELNTLQVGGTKGTELYIGGTNIKYD